MGGKYQKSEKQFFIYLFKIIKEKGLRCAIVNRAAQQLEDLELLFRNPFKLFIVSVKSGFFLQF